MPAGARSPFSPSCTSDAGCGRGIEDMTALIAFLLLIGMFVLGARVHGVRHSFWKFLVFVTACIVVLVLVLAFLAG